MYQCIIICAVCGECCINICVELKNDATGENSREHTHTVVLNPYPEGILPFAARRVTYASPALTRTLNPLDILMFLAGNWFTVDILLDYAAHCTILSCVFVLLRRTETHYPTININVRCKAGRPGSSEVPRNPLTRWDVSSIPANGIFLTKKLKN